MPSTSSPSPGVPHTAAEEAPGPPAGGETPRSPAGGQTPQSPTGGQTPPSLAGAEARRLAFVVHLAFFLLLGSALARYVQRHGDQPQEPAVLALAAALAALYVIGRRTAAGAPLPPPTHSADTRAPAPQGLPPLPALLRLGALVAVWAVLVALAPSFAWCAVPLFYTALRTLPTRAAYTLVALFTVFVVVAQLRLADRLDVDLVVGPPAVAVLATAVFTHMDRQAARQAALIRDLVRTRRELAATERREGTLAERQRLAMEIHDTLAQSLSSQRMLLQAAERVWETDPERARAHVGTAAGIAESSLAEARRFVHDLAPADLAGGGGLDAALRGLAARESTAERTVTCLIDGAPGTPGLPDRVQSALLRIAQGALANVREHSGATRAVLTLTYLEDEVRLDIADDGRGLDPAALPERAAGVRGHGLPAIRARVRRLGGTLTVESAPGDGTVVSAAVPLRPAAPSTPESTAP
ncbi:sensor histidine kinase [Streptomyces sp. SID8381]|uniref:sensor histidine kinase n=1 Tax=unclassified Streptomyces TaxID=2593676 RepID=UPI00037B10FF|nr:MULTISPECIES: sensor histidine kinase [unclassified Streptomyces]MYX30295.1 sensor histidine kinase [Streptomyces sp. SID8381]